MPKKLLEVIVTNVEEAIAAENGGADRLELIRDFAVGGLTPLPAVIVAVLKAVSIPIRVMVRERPTFDLLNDSELVQICQCVEEFSRLKVDGVVLGFIKDNQVDVGALTQIVTRTPEARITFHRAFEATPDGARSIEKIKQFPQVDRILTNSGPGNWDERLARLIKWQEMADPITMLVGGEVDEFSLPVLARSELREFHVGRAARTPETFDGKIDIAKLHNFQRGVSDTSGNLGKNN